MKYNTTMEERLRVNFEVTDIDIRDIWDTPECIKSRNAGILSILEWECECENDLTSDRLERLKEIWLIKTEI